MIVWQRRTLLALFFIGVSSGASATNLTFSGTLNEPPPCTIDDGNSIEVDFQEIGIEKVDGVNYRKGVPYIIKCGPDTLPWELKLSVNGTETTFEASAVQSSEADLGIQLLQNSAPFRLNTPLVINLMTPPVLEAVPVKKPGTTLKTGGFTATATLLAEYE